MLDSDRKERERLEEIIDRQSRIIEHLTVGKNHNAVFAKGVVMPVRILVGGNGATFRFTELAQDGVTIVPPSGPISFSSDNPAVATVDNATQVVNPDGSVSVQVAAVAANPDGSDATATIAGIDPASPNKVAAADVLTVGAAQGKPVAVSATGVLTAN